MYVCRGNNDTWAVLVLLLFYLCLFVSVFVSFFVSVFVCFFLCFFLCLLLSYLLSFFLSSFMCFSGYFCVSFCLHPVRNQPCAAAPGEAPGGRGYGGSAPNHAGVLHKSLVVPVNNSDHSRTLDAATASLLLERRSRES